MTLHPVETPARARQANRDFKRPFRSRPSTARAVSPRCPPEGTDATPGLDPVTHCVEPNRMLFAVIAPTDQRQFLHVEVGPAQRLDGLFRFDVRVKDIKGRIFFSMVFPYRTLNDSTLS